MALADTANLVVALRLDDKFSAPMGRANRSLSSFASSAGTVGKGVGQIGAGVGRIATRLAMVGVAGAAAFGGLLARNIEAGIASVRRLEQVTVATNTVLASTKGVAGQTAEGIRALALQYEDLNATIDDKVIQSAENLLLTFPKIGKQAFQPALEAALNLNQALGGGEEGLQGVIIQVGKALQDPARGLLALRRVGVAFSLDQEKRIKALVKEGKLYEAQKIILGELSKEFGGQFAAAGNTAAGRMALFRDNIENLQMTLAGPFSGVLDKIVGKLGAFMGEAGTQTAIGNLGIAIAGLFDDNAIDKGIGLLRSGLDLLTPANLQKVKDAIGSIDLSTLGKGLELTGRVAKTAIDAFMSLPPGIQAVVIAGLAANKLSGGLIGSGIGNIGKGLLGGLAGGIFTRGASPANPMWVASAQGGIPGIGGGVAGVGGLGSTLGVGTLGVAAAAIAGTAFLIYKAEQESQTPFGQAALGAHSQMSHWGTSAPLNLGAKAFASTQLTSAAVREGTVPLLSEFKRSRATSGDLYQLQRMEQSKRNSDSAAMLEKLRQSSVSLMRIEAKKTSFTVNYKTVVNAYLSAKSAQTTQTTINTIRTDYAPGDSTGGFL